MFTAQSVGEYRFCFNNEMSTFAEKMVDFEIAVCCVRPFSLASLFLYVVIRDVEYKTCFCFPAMNSFTVPLHRVAPLTYCHYN